jgi:hypothetical protein
VLVRVDEAGLQAPPPDQATRRREVQPKARWRVWFWLVVTLLLGFLALGWWLDGDRSQSNPAITEMAPTPAR